MFWRDDSKGGGGMFGGVPQFGGQGPLGWARSFMANLFGNPRESFRRQNGFGGFGPAGRYLSQVPGFAQISGMLRAGLPGDGRFSAPGAQFMPPGGRQMPWGLPRSDSGFGGFGPGMQAGPMSGPNPGGGESIRGGFEPAMRWRV